MLNLPLTVVESAANGDAGRYESDLILVRPDNFVAWTANAQVAIDAGTVLRATSGR